MERITSKPKIIEFNGLPGAGKTTIMRSLQKELDALNVPTLTRYYRRQIRWRRYITLFLPKYYNLIHLIRNYSRQFSQKKELSLCLSYVDFVKMYNDFTEDKMSGVLLIDQGAVQSLLSLAHQDFVPESPKLDKIVKKSGFDNKTLYLVNCNLDPSISEERIKSRPQKGESCRVESMDHDEVEKTLAVQTKNLSYLRNTFSKNCPFIHMIDIDASNSIEENVKKILHIFNVKENG